MLAGDKTWQVLDLVSLQGLLAHQRGEWFDRMRGELRRTRDVPEVANAVFDGYLCPAEYLLYGPTPYADVIETARGLRATALRSGALRAVAFASALIGEAALLSGDLELAADELQEAVDLHHVLGSSAGESHSLQRLAEVRLAAGDRDGAGALLDQALPLARWSIIANHLLQRIYGTMIEAAADPLVARAIVDRAESTLGLEDRCRFCSVMLVACRPSVRARTSATSTTRTATWRWPSGRRRCGRARRGRPPSPRRPAGWRWLKEIPIEPPSGCAWRWPASSAPGSRWTSNAAGAGWRPSAPDGVGASADGGAAVQHPYRGDEEGDGEGHQGDRRRHGASGERLPVLLGHEGGAGPVRRTASAGRGSARAIRTPTGRGSPR